MLHQEYIPENKGRIIISVNKPEEKHTCEKANKSPEVDTKSQELKFDQVYSDAAKQADGKPSPNEDTNKEPIHEENSEPKHENIPECEKKLIDTSTDNSGC